MHGDGPKMKAGWGTRARVKRTKNMPFTFVTLDVLKLSGWLNDDADCRVEEGRMIRHERSGSREVPRRWDRAWGRRHARRRPE